MMRRWDGRLRVLHLVPEATYCNRAPSKEGLEPQICYAPPLPYTLPFCDGLPVIEVEL